MNNIIKYLDKLTEYFDYKEEFDLSNINGLKLEIYAKVFVLVKNEEMLQDFFRLLERNKTPYFFWGGGYNTISFKKRYDGVIISLSKNFSYIKKRDDGLVYIGGATPNHVALKELHKIGKMGLECMHRIPGTVGGSLVGNAGMREESIKEYLDHIVIIDAFGKRKIKKQDIAFEYRDSNIKNLIIESAFNFPTLNSSAFEKMDRIEDIKRNQPYDKPSVGCIFKNPQGCKYTAAELIKQSGLGEEKFGPFEVSKDHANFIINNKQEEFSSPFHLHTLITRIATRVRELSKERIELEVKILKDEK